MTAIEPYRALVLSGTNDGFQWVWQFGLYPLDEGRTRLVSRGTQRVADTISTWLFMRVMEPAAFIMTRRMLLGVKQRAEAAESGAHRPESSESASGMIRPKSEVNRVQTRHRLQHQFTSDKKHHGEHRLYDH